MRSLEEIAFRLRQEAADLRLLLAEPSLPEGIAGMAPLLPDTAWCVSHLRGTGFAREVESLAENILAHRFPLLGVSIETGPEIDWRRDYLNHVSSGTQYCRLVPYLDFAAVGDHKAVWELNRHQHIVILAQTFRFTGRREFLNEGLLQIRGWIRSNPFMRGINWTSALEVAFRALSWTWFFYLVSEWMPDDFRRELLAQLWRHALYLRHNLSVHFSPNTHLLGEAVALHALGVLFPTIPRAAEFAETGRALVWRQMETQVREDGSHFEQSSYYHVYALDLFLFHQLLADTPAWYREKLARMTDYLAALVGPARHLPMMGDDDGGRLFHPYGRRETFGRATLATCARLLGEERWPYEEQDLHSQAVWWLGSKAAAGGCQSTARSSRLFANAGIAISEGPAQAIMDTGPFGAGTAGHSHSDTLSLIVRRGGEEILADAGTYRYMGDEAARNWFRGTAAHNTLRIDKLEQATPAGPFRWRELPEVELLTWETSDGQDYVDAVCRYHGFQHRRKVLFAKAEGLLFVLDEVEGPPGPHLIEIFWHPGEASTMIAPTCFRIGRQTLLAVAGSSAVEFSLGGEHGWRSSALYEKREAPVIRAELTSVLPACVATVVDLRGVGTAGEARLSGGVSERVLRWDCAGSQAARFGARAILDRK